VIRTLDHSHDTVATLSIADHTATFAPSFVPSPRHTLQLVESSQDGQGERAIAVITRSTLEARGIILHVDQHDQVVHFDVSDQVGLWLKKAEQGPLPHLTQKSTQQAKQEQQVENQSLIQRYWHVIIPILVVLLFSGAGGDEGQKAAGEGEPVPAQ